MHFNAGHSLVIGLSDGVLAWYMAGFQEPTQELTQTFPFERLNPPKVLICKVDIEINRSTLIVSIDNDRRCAVCIPV